MGVYPPLKGLSMTKRMRSTFARPKPTKEAKKRILIVSEGEKTEPTYFEDLRKSLGINSSNIRMLPTGSHSSPITVVKDAKDFLLTDNDFDEVYCVFDKDKHDEAGKAYTKAIAACKNQKNPKFYAITSVICFEVWLLMHYSSSLKGHTCCDDLLKEFKKIPELKSYKKGQNNVFAITKDKLITAIKNAKHAEREAKQVNSDNPTTKIYLLVEAIQKMAK